MRSENDGFRAYIVTGATSPLEVIYEKQNALPDHAPPKKASDFGIAPTIVPVEGCEALIAPVSYVQWLKEAVGGLSIPHRARGVKGWKSICGPATIILSRSQQ